MGEQQQFVSEFKPTLVDYKDFNAAKDAVALRDAMQGAGTDEQAIIDIVAYRTLKQRLEIEATYMQLFELDLKEDFKSELSGYFLETILAMFYPDDVGDARFLYNAIEGAGTDEECLIDILTTRTNSQIGKIKEAYKEKYDEHLEAAIIGDTSGDFKNFLVILVQGNRDESDIIDDNLAILDAAALYRAGEGMPGTDEDKFNEIFCNRSFPQLGATFSEYDKIAGHSITTAISQEFSGDLLNGLMAIIEITDSLPKYFARKLNYAMQGAGTYEDILIRIVVTRCEKDMVEIKDEFQKLTHKSLYSAIKDDTSGDFQRILLCLVGQ